MSDETRIETTPDGPFLLHGPTAVRAVRSVESSAGEPMTWVSGERIERDGDPLALCRCGHSGDKPFCDGSHADAEWDPADAEHPEESYVERARRLGTPDGVDYELLDDTSLCMHAGFCGSARTTVWKMLPDTDDTEVLGKVVRMVEKCPSGRITNVIGGDPVEPPLPQEVGVVPGGPLWVTGGIPVDGADGQRREQRARMTLCRCGASDKKPLCDGSHRDIDFDG